MIFVADLEKKKKNEKKKQKQKKSGKKETGEKEKMEKKEEKSGKTKERNGGRNKKKEKKMFLVMKRKTCWKKTQEAVNFEKLWKEVLKRCLIREMRWKEEREKEA